MASKTSYRSNRTKASMAASEKHLVWCKEHGVSIWETKLGPEEL